MAAAPSSTPPTHQCYAACHVIRNTARAVQHGRYYRTTNHPSLPNGPVDRNTTCNYLHEARGTHHDIFFIQGAITRELAAPAAVRCDGRRGGKCIQQPLPPPSHSALGRLPAPVPPGAPHLWRGTRPGPLGSLGALTGNLHPSPLGATMGGAPSTNSAAVVGAGSGERMRVG